jgi:hypothetical protein
MRPGRSSPSPVRPARTSCPTPPSPSWLPRPCHRPHRPRRRHRPQPRHHRTATPPMRVNASRSASVTMTVLAAPATGPTTCKARSEWSVLMSSTWTATATAWAAKPEAERRSVHLQLPGLVGRRRGQWSSNPHRCGHDLGWFSAVRFRPATNSLATSACRSSQASPGFWYMRATCSPAARRWRMTAMTWRLAVASAPAPKWGAGPGRPASPRVITG